ncbi:hypothetical protein CASFOL_027243 [Castilleja foliolosa]|uniref:Uncharacterized protein n=1 Tax=Castilleja foliolosa TaxID=1961234 RepID=A0ABD3CF51_9LAMI
MSSEDKIFSLFQRWERVYPNSLSSQDKNKRFEAFKTNALYVHNYNKQDNQHKLALNQFFDMMMDEFNKWTLSNMNDDQLFKGENQTTPFMYEFIKKNGIATDIDYPYIGKKGQCAYANVEAAVVVKIDGYENVPKNNESALLRAVAHQPVTAIVAAGSPDFKHHGKMGIFKGECGGEMNHAVTIVGYGRTSCGIKYWIAKNSWGSKLLRGVNGKGGQCGIARSPAYPVMKLLE